MTRDIHNRLHERLSDRILCGEMDEKMRHRDDLHREDADARFSIDATLSGVSCARITLSSIVCRVRELLTESGYAVDAQGWLPERGEKSLYCWQLRGGLYGPVLVCAVAGHWSAVRVSRRRPDGGVDAGMWVDPADATTFLRSIVDRLAFAYPDERCGEDCPVCHPNGSDEAFDACPACGHVRGGSPRA